VDTKRRRELLKDLQQYGVTEYAEGDLRIRLGAAPASPELPPTQPQGSDEVDDDSDMGDPRLLLEKLAQANGKVPRQ
jgi:hypothetical protein